jgi:hypothetical protein
VKEADMAECEQSSQEAAATVAWTTGAFQLTIHYRSAAELTLPFHVELPSGSSGYSLTLYTCSARLEAWNGEAACTATALPVVGGDSTVRWVLEQTDYRLGRNSYVLTLELIGGGSTSTDDLSVVVSVVP